MPLRLVFCLLFLVTTLARGQATRPEEDGLQISVITLGPGRMIYERYGHVAIRIRNEPTQLDLTYDWGNFSFDDPNFLGKFIKGDLWYWMQGVEAWRFIDHYAGDEDRTMVERVLDLSPQQKLKLIAIIRDQDDEQHRYYLYDYFKDNCSTRVRDVIDVASDGALQQSKAIDTGATYRDHNRRLLQVGWDNYVLMTGMELVTGPRLDVPLSRWDACYLPTLLGDALDQAKFADGRPLVRQKRVLNETKTPANFEPTTPANPAYWTLPIGIGTGLAFVALSIAWPLGFRVLAFGWELFVLVGAIFMPTIILFTRHWVVAWNENSLQLTPLALPILWLLTRRSPSAFARLLWPGLALALSLLGGLVTISHSTPQHNAPAVLLCLPIHAAVFVGLVRLGKRSHVQPSEGPHEVPPAA